jgi:hypothetical protein
MGRFAPPGVAWFQEQSAPCSRPPPPLPQWFSLQKGQIAGAPPPPELPEKGVRSPLTPPQGNTVYRLQKNATLRCVPSMHPNPQPKGAHDRTETF